MIITQSDFSITPLHKKDNYYGFTLEQNPIHLMPNGTEFHNSGKSVMEQSIVGHVSRNEDRFQLVGVDCKRVEFNLLRGVKGVKGVALDVPTAAATVANFQKIMMDRFKFMEQMKVNNVYKIKEKEVNYFEIFGMKVQFDEMFELTVDLDENDRKYAKLKLIYPEGRQPIILTAQEIYDGMQEGRWDGKHPQLPEYKGYNSYISTESLRMTKGIYVPKALVFLADELNELMTSDDYQSVDTVKGALGSIARLGRAAGVHLALACQRASGSTISTDLKNNIQMSVLLGGFDDGASQLMFEKDISNLAKPEIKGRGFIGSGNEIIETQTYYTQPEKDWEFDTNQKLTYQNPVFEEQCKVRGLKFDELNTGWVKQHRLDEPDDGDDDDNGGNPPETPNAPEEAKKPEKDPDEFDPNEGENDPLNMDFNMGEVGTTESVTAPKISMEELNSIWGTTTEEPTSETSEEPNEMTEATAEMIAGITPTPTRDKVESALGTAPTGKPKIKLNVDPTEQKNKIKLNLKSRGQDT